MRNHIFVFLLMGMMFFVSKPVMAQTEEATSSEDVKTSSTSAVDDKEIQDLKEKIATKVAQLREKNNRAVGGTVTSITGSTLKIHAYDEKEYDVKIDKALTKIYQIVNNQKKEVTLDDVEKGSYIVVTGDLNDGVMTANFLYVDEFFIVGSGTISEVDKDDYSIRVLTTDKETYTLDIETFTKQLMLNIKTVQSETIGFSKVKEGDTIHFVIKKTGSEKQVNRYAAQKIFIIPQEYFIK